MTIVKEFGFEVGHGQSLPETDPSAPVPAPHHNLLLMAYHPRSIGWRSAGVAPATAIGVVAGVESGSPMQSTLFYGQYRCLK